VYVLAIEAGDTVTFVDTRGTTWFGVAEGPVQPGRKWPVIRVRIGRRVADVPARDVNPWPAPGSERTTVPDAVPRPRPASDPTNRSPYVLGDAVILVVPVSDGWRRRIRRGARGVIVGRVRPGEFIVQFTSGRTAMARASQLRRYTPPKPARPPADLPGISEAGLGRP
jgi:hypothetical protein